MDLLENARHTIDEVDAQMAELFEKRMQAVTDVARWKAENGRPVLDAAREQAVIDRNTARIQKAELRPYYRTFLCEAMAVSRAYQQALLGRDTAAYQGVEGAWSHIALRTLYPQARALACETWADVFDAVEENRAEVGVLPFENSNAGDVSSVLDLLYLHKDLYVCRMYDLPIRQDLLGVAGAALGDIKTVVSHQQALAQAAPFLRLHHFATESWGNTADAARHVAQLKRRDTAAIASAETAQLYGLTVLAEGVNEDGDNTTRFAVITRRRPEGVGNRIALLFTVDHKPGKLAQVIQLIGQQGYNMESIKSRPLPHVQFEYYFYVQLICPQRGGEQAALEQLLHSLDSVCRTVRVLGTFECDRK
jgi:chorismate mutase/prephenate dehydratase